MGSENLFFPVRSEAGKRALDIFYRGFNEVNFYFEDKDHHNFYSEVVKRIFPNLKLSRVFPLNGKSSIFQHAESTRGDISQLHVYVVDKDFDDLLAKINEDDERIFYLEKYCIENYLIDEEALIAVVMETYPKISEAVIAEELNFDVMKTTFIYELATLFRLFYCVQRLQLGIENCKTVPERYAHKNYHWKIDDDLVVAYREKVKITAQEKAIHPPLIDPITDVRCIIKECVDPDKYISGKFMLALMFHYTKSKYKMGSITQDSFMFRLVKNCSLDSLLPLATRILAHVEQAKAS